MRSFPTFRNIDAKSRNGCDLSIFFSGPKWNKKSLTWRLNNFTPDLANSVVRYVSLSGQYGNRMLHTDYDKKAKSRNIDAKIRKIEKKIKSRKSRNNHRKVASMNYNQLF
jgi:hypothetical protein